MQTFLTSPLFAESARVLDRQRLGKQRSEAVALVRAITVGNGWRNHPAARMWEGHVYALMLYYNAIVEEWVRRGYQHNGGYYDPPRTAMPPWLGYGPLHASHRANLLRKDPEWYGQFGWPEKPRQGYYWPV